MKSYRSVFMADKWTPMRAKSYLQMMPDVIGRKTKSGDRDTAINLHKPRSVHLKCCFCVNGLWLRPLFAPTRLSMIYSTIILMFLDRFLDICLVFTKKKFLFKSFFYLKLNKNYFECAFLNFWKLFNLAPNVGFQFQQKKCLSKEKNNLFLNEIKLKNWS